MLPVFNEYRKMLKDFNIDLSQYDEDKLWIDHQIIRGFGKNGKQYKICRLKVTDDLEYEHKFYEELPKNEDLYSFEELYNVYEDEILAKEKQSLDIIKREVPRLYRGGTPSFCPLLWVKIVN